LIKPAVNFIPRESVAVPELGLVDAVEHEIGQGDWIDQVLLLPAIEGPAGERIDVVGRYAGLPELIDRGDDPVGGVGRAVVSAESREKRIRCQAVWRRALRKSSSFR